MFAFQAHGLDVLCTNTKQHDFFGSLPFLYSYNVNTYDINPKVKNFYCYKLVLNETKLILHYPFPIKESTFHIYFLNDGLKKNNENKIKGICN